MRNRIIYASIAASALILSCILSVSCKKTDKDFRGSSPVSVSFGLGQGSSILDVKSRIADDGCTAIWQKGDKVALWATKEDGTPVLEGTPFTLQGISDNTALFTGELQSAMEEGTYTYVVASPLPASVSGSTAEFVLPAEQDGKAGNADIMVSEKVTHGPLKEYSIESEDYSGMATTISRHFTHLFNFYLPEGSDGLKVESEGMAHGEPVKRIDIGLPWNAAGRLTLDVNSPDQCEQNGTDTLVRLRLKEALKPSTADGRNYATASVLPMDCTASEGGKIKLTLYSENYIGHVDDVSVDGRDFKPGHATPVKMTVTECIRKKLNVKLRSNNLGEHITSIAIEAAGDFSSSIGNVYSTSLSSGIEVGSEYLLKCGSEAFQNLAGTKLKITCQSKHVRFTTTATLPADLDSYNEYAVNIDVPYLLFEDFSTVPSFSSYDEYSGGFYSGDKDPYVFLRDASSGHFWSGERIGAQEGTAVRLAARRETSARYHSRLDSYPLLEIISPVTVNLSFDCGMDEDHTKLTGKQYGQTIYVGYTDNLSAIGNGSTKGTYPANFFLNEKGSTYTTLSTHKDLKINLPAGTFRISWRTEVEDHAGINNNTDWLYIDNVKVQVAQ
ncbi:MAG: hypothetical protein MJY45_03465 [Bacteroidales bacterium]|nr:hypothetical protein [Bacteroidales bacterium]